MTLKATSDGKLNLHGAGGDSRNNIITIAIVPKEALAAELVKPVFLCFHPLKGYSTSFRTGADRGMEKAMLLLQARQTAHGSLRPSGLIVYFLPIQLSIPVAARLD